jgi:hemerythrin-like metal-binding protein
MALLQWKDEYSVGIEDVDYEHQELIDIINRLHDLLIADDAKLTVPRFFDELLNGVSAHFTLEERIMSENNDVHLDEHKSDHDRLLDEIRDVKEAFEHAEEIDSTELALRLEPWFVRHFQTHDTLLHRSMGSH